MCKFGFPEIDLKLRCHIRLCVTMFTYLSVFFIPPTIMPFSKLAFAASVAALHSFVAAESIITPGPSPTQALSPRQVAGGPGTPILSTLTYAFSDLPEQVYPFAVLRGPQFGYNICNSTTEGPDSNCQTLIFNNAVCLLSSYRSRLYVFTE